MHRLRTHRGFSLIEVIIALVIFTILMGALFESMTSAKRYETTSIVQDDLTLDSQTTVRAVLADLAASGWYFYGNKDANGDGTIQASENPDGLATTTVNFSDAASDRRQRYYPYVRGETVATLGTAFPTRVDVDAGNCSDLRGNPLCQLSPWTTRLYPSWNGSQVATYARAVMQRAKSQGLMLPSAPDLISADGNAVNQLATQAEDLVGAMVKPSNELIFLRCASGPWREDPSADDSVLPSDLGFFPSYGISSAHVVVKPKAAPAVDWRNPGDQKSPSNPNGMPVLFPSAYAVDGSGNFQHRNALLASTDPNYHKPYGAQSWGAYLDDSGSGLQIRMQWETITADRMFRDPNPGVDDLPLPDDLREFTYAVIPSPVGLGRLVRAHTVLLKTPAQALGVEVGDWITQPGAPRGFQIDKILSDNVVRVVWMTRRHDPNLGVNQVRARFVFARAGRQSENGQRNLVYRQVDQVFTMRASNDYDDQKSSQSSIDIGSNNVPFVF